MGVELTATLGSPRDILPILSQRRIAHELVLTFENRLDLQDIPFLEDIMNSNDLTRSISHMLDGGGQLLVENISFSRYFLRAYSYPT